VAILDDFGKLTEYGPGKPRSQGSGLHKSMGHAEELEQFVRAVKGEPNHLLSWEGSSLATLCMFAAQESIRLGAEIDLDQFHRSLLADPEEVPGSPDADGAQADSANSADPDPANPQQAGAPAGHG
jgi:hypothetical protein